MLQFIDLCILLNVIVVGESHSCVRNCECVMSPSIINVCTVYFINIFPNDICRSIQLCDDRMSIKKYTMHTADTVDLYGAFEQKCLLMVDLLSNILLFYTSLCQIELVFLINPFALRLSLCCMKYGMSQLGCKINDIATFPSPIDVSIFLPAAELRMKLCAGQNKSREVSDFVSALAKDVPVQHLLRKKNVWLRNKNGLVVLFF